MDGQAWVAVAIAVVAATWLARRFFMRGFDDEPHDCSGCSVAKPLAEKPTGLSRRPETHERPAEVGSNGRTITRP